ncbi:MAG: glutamate racemase [Acidobacteriota bacterium]|nr:glutamate racemase [Acidobacteriota bacterium]
MLNNLPIGIFDSGVGGLTIYRALHERLPNERFVYLGDTARVPYGTKSLATIERYAIENSRFLAARGVKLLVVACNTASALALPAIQNAIKIDVVGMIEPGARKAVETGATRIGVIATEATIGSGAYTKAIRNFNQQTEVVETSCPLFVPLAEEGWAKEPETASVAAKYLAKIKEAKADALVLGCTHYPILRDVIQETVGASVKLIDSGEAAAETVERLLKNKNLANLAVAQNSVERTLCDDLDHFFVTDAAERFARVAERFLGAQPARLEAVELWGNDELRTN